MIDANPATPASELARAAHPKPGRSRARARFNQGMRWVRRAHLYTGLFMTPWVFLYGISGMLFNHPDRFTDVAVTPFAPDAIQGGTFGTAIHADHIAARVVAALNASQPTSADPYHLVRPAEAAYSRDLFALGVGAERNYSIRVDLEHDRGSVRPAEPPNTRVKRVGPIGGVKLDPPPFQPVADQMPAVMGRLGLPVKSVSVRTPPELTFLVEQKGQTSRINYNPTTGITTARSEDSAAPLSWRRFMILLHVAHEFPSRVNARWFWAIAVDLMFVSMVGWGFTGLLMWWQMKNVRTVGIVVLVASAITATAMAVGMHQILTQ